MFSAGVFFAHHMCNNTVDHKETGERQARGPCSNPHKREGAKACMMGLCVVGFFSFLVILLESSRHDDGSFSVLPSLFAVIRGGIEPWNSFTLHQNRKEKGILHI